MISMKTVVKVFFFALLVGIIPAKLVCENHESNVLQPQVHTDEPDLVATDEESYDELDSRISKNSLPDETFDFDSIGDDDEDDDY